MRSKTRIGMALLVALTLIGVFALRTEAVVPTVTRIAQTSGSTQGGTFVTITGSDFLNPVASAIHFGQNSCQYFLVLSDSELLALSPAGTGTVDVRVTNASGQSANTSDDDFTYVAVAGSISLADKSVLLNGGDPYKLVSSDFNQDGKLDIAVAAGYGTDLKVLKNNSTVGTISFSTDATLSMLTGAGGVAVGDFNDDGKPDLITTHSASDPDPQKISVFPNTSTAGGNITFGTRFDYTLTGGETFAPTSVCAGDFNRDGLADFAVLQGFFNVGFYQNTWNGSTLGFSFQFYRDTDTISSHILTSDFDNDQLPDVALCNLYGDNVYIYENDSTGGTMSFEPTAVIKSGTVGLQQITAHDLDRPLNQASDGLMDLASADGYNNSFSHYLNTSAASNVSFADSVNILAGFGPYSINSSDLDGDGRVEIITGDGDGLSLFKNITSTANQITFGTPILKSGGQEGAAATDMVCADYDGDGKNDVAAILGNYSEVVIFRNTTTPSFVINITGIGPEVAEDGKVYFHTPYVLCTVTTQTSGNAVLRITESGLPVSADMNITLDNGTHSFVVPCNSLPDGAHTLAVQLEFQSQQYNSTGTGVTLQGTRDQLDPNHADPYWNYCIYGGRTNTAAADVNLLTLEELSSMYAPEASPCLRGNSVKVNLMNGATNFTICPLEIAVLGMDFKLILDYDSNARFFSPFGANIQSVFDYRLVPGSGTNQIMVGVGGRDATFTTSNGIDYTTTVPGYFGTLTRNGTTLEFTYHEPNGLKLTFNKNGWLTSYKDPNNNEMLIVRDTYGYVTSVTDTHNRSITWTYDHALTDKFLRYVTTVTDFGSRAATFTYENNDLKTYTLPPVTGMPLGDQNFASGKTTTFTWSTATETDPRLKHNLKTVLDPRNIETDVVLNYLSSDKLDTARVGNAAATVGGTHDFNYAANLTVHIDRRNIQTNYNFDGSGRLDTVVENANLTTYTTNFDWNADNLVSRIEFPKLNEVTYIYDTANGVRAKGNLLFEVHDPTPVTTQTEIVHAYTYELNRNQIATYTEPRGFPNGAADIAGFNPNNPPYARYTTRYEYLQPNTNLSKITYPQITGGNPNLPTITHNSINYSNLNQVIEELYVWNTLGQVTLYTNPEGDQVQYNYFASGITEHYLQNVKVDFGTLNLTTTYGRDQYGNVTSVTDPKNQTTNLIVNQLNQTVRVLSRPPLWDPASSSNPNPSIRYITDTVHDANDNVLRVEHDNLDEAGNAYAHARVISSATFDVLDNVITSTEDQSPNGGPDQFATTSYTYDPSENLRVLTKPVGNRVANEYDDRDLLFKKHIDTDAAGNPLANASTFQFDYDGNRNLTTSTDAADNGGTAGGEVTTYAYDGFDRVLTVTMPNGSVRTTAYDLASNVTLSTLNGVTIDSSSGSPVTRTLSQMQRFYDELGRTYLARANHHNPHIGNPGDPGANIGDGLSESKMVYYPDSLLQASADDRNVATLQEYDGANRLIRTTDMLLNKIEYDYDANSNILTKRQIEVSTDLATPSETFETDYVYDGIDRQVRLDGPNCACSGTGLLEDTVYDSRSNTVLRYDGLVGTGSLGNKTQFLYDAANRLRQTTRYLTSTGKGGGSPAGDILTSQNYDLNSRLTEQRDDENNLTATQYDTHDRPTLTTYADTTTSSVTYDPDNHIITRTDQNGTLVTYTPDDVARTLQVDVTSAPVTIQGSDFEHFTYDGRGLLLTAVNSDFRNGFTDVDSAIDFGADNIVTRRYDSLGNRLLDREAWDGKTPQNYTREFDGNSNLTKLSYVTTGISYRYEQETGYNRTRMIHYDGSMTNDLITSLYQYKGPQRLERRTVNFAGFSGSTANVSNFGYDTAYRLISLEHSTNGTGPDPIDTLYEYGWDEMYNRQFEKTTKVNVAFGAYESKVYAYDSVYRVKRGEYDPDLTLYMGGDDLDPNLIPDSLFFEKFMLTDTNNRSQVDYQTGGVTVENYSYTETVTNPPADDQMNQYTTKNDTGTPSAERNYEYDPNGNRTKADYLNSSLEEYWDYDFKNRVIRYSTNSGFEELYEYDALNRRIKRTRPISMALMQSGDLPARKRPDAEVVNESVAERGKLPEPIPQTEDGSNPKSRLGTGCGTGPEPILHYFWDGPQVVETRDIDLCLIALYSHVHGVPGNPGGSLGAPFHVFGVTDFVNQSGFHYQVWEDSQGSARELSIENTAIKGTIHSLMVTDTFGSPTLAERDYGTGNYNVLSGNQEPISQCFYTFQGQWFDFIPYEYYLRNRYYDPTDGQFLSVDSMTAWFDPANFGNGHTAFGNNSANWWDPCGAETHPNSQGLEDLCDLITKAVDWATPYITGAAEVIAENVVEKPLQKAADAMTAANKKYGPAGGITASFIATGVIIEAVLGGYFIAPYAVDFYLTSAYELQQAVAWYMENDFWIDPIAGAVWGAAVATVEKWQDVARKAQKQDVKVGKAPEQHPLLGKYNKNTLIGPHTWYGIGKPSNQPKNRSKAKNERKSGLGPWEPEWSVLK